MRTSTFSFVRGSAVLSTGTSYAFFSGVGRRISLVQPLKIVGVSHTPMCGFFVALALALTLAPAVKMRKN